MSQITYNQAIVEVLISIKKELSEVNNKLDKILDRPVFDPEKPVNRYGENFVDGIQNAIERGQRGINSND